MFGKTASYIIRFRIPFLVVFLLLTVYMAFRSREVTMSYRLASLMPKTDSSYVAYERFKETFGQDGNMIIIANKESHFFTKEHLNAFFRLQDDLGKIPGVKYAGGLKNVMEIIKDSTEKKFAARSIWEGKIESEADAVLLQNRLRHLPFYDRFLFDLKKDVYLILVTLEQEVLNTKKRLDVVEAIDKRVGQFRKERSTEVYISGLPYIRAVYVKKAEREIILFVGLAALVTAIVLTVIFRSFIEVVVPLVTVLLGVIWAQGSLALLGFEITILTGLIPPLLIVIGVPNAIYIINKYHREFNLSGDKKAALATTVEKTGHAIFLTNLTTAVGFGTFVITRSDILVEFGIVAFINIMMLFLLSIILIPILFSFLPPPSVRVRAHMDKRLVKAVIRVLILLSQYYRPWIYGASLLILILSAVGISRIEVKGNMVDDVPEKSQLMKDLRFFENVFGGVMPLEITVDTRKERGIITDARTWRKIEELQEYLDAQPVFSRPLSYIEGIKFANQAFYNGNPEEYQLPNQFDRVFIVNYLKKDEGQDSLLTNFMNKDKSMARISVMMKDLNTIEIQDIKKDLRQKVVEVFPEDKYKVDITGATITFLEGTKYLVHNLFQSLILAVVLISLFMAILFKNLRVVIISLIPNILPMLVTAALMGFLGIPLKPSTILIFSVAFGISVDDTIHFLAKFKDELKHNAQNIRSAVVKSLREVGLSMAYTSVVLFFGFSVFAASEFGGTVALGMLVSFSLLAAMFTNLILLPCLLMTLHNSRSNRRKLGKRKLQSIPS